MGPAELQRWKKWAGSILEASCELSKLQKTRTRKWNALSVRLWRSKMRDEVADGLTGCLYKSTFNQGEERQSLTSMWVQGRLLTIRAEVAEGAAKFMANLSKPDCWNQVPYVFEDESTHHIPAGPWKGLPRANKALLEVFREGPWARHRAELRDTMKAPTMVEFLREIGKGSIGSAAGITGTSYGLLRAFPAALQELLLLWVTIAVRFAVVPAAWLHLIIVALPKGSSQVGGFQGCRPISLYEIILKVATGIVHTRVGRVITQHSLLNDRQIFNVRNRGVQEALHLVLTAMHRTIGHSNPVYIASTDVAGAFPGIPHWYLRFVMEGNGAPEQMIRFYELADGEGQFYMRVEGGFSKGHKKSSIGLGQGEKGSPEKYVICIDPLLRYLQKYKEHGLYIGQGKAPTWTGEGIPVCIGDWLVAILFCDDMLVVSGTHAGLQTLLDKAGEVYDFAGSRQVAYKSYAGCSVEMPPPQVKLHQGNWTALRLREEAIQWMNMIGKETKEGMDVLDWATKHLLQKGEEVVLRVTEDGPWKSMAVGNASWPILTALGDAVTRDGHKVEDQREGTLLHHLRGQGWTGQHEVGNRPFHFVDIRTGLREYLQTVAPTAAFRYLGAQVSPHLNWKKHSEKIRADLSTLTRQVEGARKTWGPELLSVATIGKIMGTARFAFTFVPIRADTVRQLDGRIAKALSSSYGLGYGISPWQVRQAPPMGVSMPSLTATQRQTYVQHAFSMLNSDLEEGKQTRLSLQEYGERKGIEGCPLAIPLHPLEVRREGPQDEYWDLARELMTQMEIAIDTKDSDSTPRLAPWQVAIPTQARGSISASQQTELQANMRKLVKQGDKEGEVMLTNTATT